MYKVEVKDLKRKCNPELFQEVDACDEICKEILGQSRAIKAIETGLSIDRKGYNIFVSGGPGTGRNSNTYSLTLASSKEKSIESDWCYVHNFKQQDHPRAIEVPLGQSMVLKSNMEWLIQRLIVEFPKHFTSKLYDDRRKNIIKIYARMRKEALDNLNRIAHQYQFEYQMSEKGLLYYPIVDGHIMTNEEAEKLSPEQMESLQEQYLEMNNHTIEEIQKLRKIDDDQMEKLLELREKEAKKVIDLYLDKIRNRFSDNKKLMNHFAEMTDDMIHHLEEFVKAAQQGKDLNINESFFLRYLVNPLIYHEPNDDDAPLIQAANPTYENLFGTVTYRLQNNLVYTDHMQIRMGSIHEANGGYLILQAYDLLKNPYAWEGLKRVLKNEAIAIEPINLNTIITRVLKPEPIPLKVKVILIGDPRLYYLLLENDPDFAKLFKIRADFEVDMPRTDENMVKMGKFVRFQCRENKLLPFDHSAMAEMVEFSSRAVENQDKLSTQFNSMADLMIQADALAVQEGIKEVTAKEIRAAIEQRNQRNNKYEERLLHAFEVGDLILDTHGKVVGQINGLTVMDSGEYRFGMPARITVSTYAGEEGVVNIEREIQQSGAIHDKGVMIIAGYLGSKFAVHNPLALSSSITFEQSYSYIEGDSASSTELYGLISSLAEIPIKQSIAVTGSVNQKGEIQPIGGVNEKIEGFYNVCKIKGLRGGEGVMIPIQNVKNLMLSDEVIRAVEAGEFTVYAVSTIDEGIEILMDGKVGIPDENGEYPPETIFGKVQERIDYFAQLIKDQND